MELSDKELLTMFHNLSSHDGMCDLRLWEKGALFCLQVDEANKPDGAQLECSQLRAYLRNCIGSEKNLGLDLSVFDAWISAGVEASVLEPKDKIRLHTEIILGKARLKREHREAILSEPQTRQNILEKIKGSSEEKMILKEIELLERKKLLRQPDSDVKKRIQNLLGVKMAQKAKEGIAPSKKISTNVKDKDSDALKAARRIAKGKNIDPLEKRAKDFAKIREKFAGKGE